MKLEHEILSGITLF